MVVLSLTVLLMWLWEAVSTASTYVAVLLGHGTCPHTSSRGGTASRC